MRENRTYGSEGGEGVSPSLPLSGFHLVTKLPSGTGYAPHQERLTSGATS
jgi:hypothetical protein